jgi:hypothetical protein
MQGSQVAYGKNPTVYISGRIKGTTVCSTEFCSVTYSLEWSSATGWQKRADPSHTLPFTLAVPH